MTFAQLGPEALTGSGLQLPVLLRRIFTAYHFPDPWELISPDAEAMQEQQRQAALAQQNPFYQAQAKAHGQMAAQRDQSYQETLQKLLDAALARSGGGQEQTPQAQP